MGYILVWHLQKIQCHKHLVYNKILHLSKCEFLDEAALEVLAEKSGVLHLYGITLNVRTTDADPTSVLCGKLRKHMELPWVVQFAKMVNTAKFYTRQSSIFPLLTQ